MNDLQLLKILDNANAANRALANAIRIITECGVGGDPKQAQKEYNCEIEAANRNANIMFAEIDDVQQVEDVT